MKKDYFILFLLIFYLFFQLSTLDYGTKINDFDFINNNSKDTSFITNIILKRDKIIETKNNIVENNKKKFFRYKLYSIEADEMLSVMALSKIALEKNLDPHYYQYGGSFLYPLGTYYFILNKLNIFKFNNFQELLKDQSKIDKIYFFGRIFVLLSFIISAYILYLILKLLSSRNLSLKLTTIYLFAPSSIMFSQIIKPHWYSLIWINLIIYNLIKMKIENKDFNKRIIFISLFIGICIGSALHNIIFVIFIFLFTFFYFKKELFKLNQLLISVFFIICAFVITNPLLILNSKVILIEYFNLFNWFKGSLNVSKFLDFYKNSLITGFGLANIVFLIYFLSKKKNFKYLKKLTFILLIPMLLISILTAQQNEWHTNFRFIPSFLPIMLIFFSIIKNKKKSLIVNILIFLTIIQMLPLKLAYYDENHQKYSTRLNAAIWITKNINTNDRICFPGREAAPYNVPPINFNKYTVVNNKCNWEIVTIRTTDDYKKNLNKNIIVEFKPRFLVIFPRTVFSHINPVIRIIKI